MLLLDENEPAELVKLLRQSAEVSVLPLNDKHMGDVYFTARSKSFQFSRKQAGELLGNVDEAEDQLADYYNSADITMQIVEGILSPIKIGYQPVAVHSSRTATIREQAGGMFAYKVEYNGFIPPGHAFDTPASYLAAWIHRLAMAGISTYYTVNVVHTAKVIIAIMRNEEKPEELHKTLNRIIPPRIQIRAQDPFVKAVMALSIVFRFGIGEDRAMALKRAGYNSLLDLSMASVSELCECEGIGRVTAEKLLKAIGREVGDKGE